ncbi:MAG: DUF1353 domain-containing protein [Chlorobiaceae bacterium]|jgi:hypothetical protein|nr:DUF1353 domain-containing protein [Chlorobiaceae bacterium]NTW62624.1 DUF1353 domain-containing protein [Chlorobiaceae bacterium]
MKSLILAMFFLFLSGCGASWHYSNTGTGTLKGKVLVQWIAPDQFMFIPDDSDPLTFTRSNGSVIKPEKMFTDGGSIPRPMWAFRNYSPWGYAPAFMIHDWLFVMKQCRLPGYEQYNHRIAADIMAEVMKTLMEDPRYGGRNKLVHYSMYKAVSSSIAEESWENGACHQPGDRSIDAFAKNPRMEYLITFP